MLFANIDILDENLDHKRGMFVGTEGSHITYVGAEEPADAARFGERYDGTGKLLMSAFYNTHAHTPMTLLRGYAENQPLQQWLNDTVWPFEGKMDMEKKHHYWGCMLSQAEMLRYGVVGFTDMYFATIDRCEATLEAGMKANHCDGGTMCFVETDYDTLPVAAVNEQLFAEYQNAGDGRVKIDMCVHGEYTTPQGMIERCVAEAKAHENLGEGIRLLNEFMNNYRIVGGGYDCTNMSSSVENFTNELMLQKRIEFWGEGIVMFDMKRLDMSPRRGYVGTNSPASYRLNTKGRAPYWNFVISRGETQNNPVIATQNNPDPSQTVKPWNG